MIAECKAADALSLNSLGKVAPLTYAQLAEDAEAEGETIEEHLADTNLDEYVRELIDWCYNEIENLEKKMERYPVVTALAEKAKHKLCVPWQQLEVLTKYQTALDNQLYKAMRALKQAQAWRINSIDAIDPPDEIAPADAA